MVGAGLVPAKPLRTAHYPSATPRALVRPPPPPPRFRVPSTAMPTRRRRACGLMCGRSIGRLSRAPHGSHSDCEAMVSWIASSQGASGAGLLMHRQFPFACASHAGMQARLCHASLRGGSFVQRRAWFCECECTVIPPNRVRRCATSACVEVGHVRHRWVHFLEVPGRGDESACAPKAIPGDR